MEEEEEEEDEEEEDTLTSGDQINQLADEVGCEIGRLLRLKILWKAPANLVLIKVFCKPILRI